MHSHVLFIWNEARSSPIIGYDKYIATIYVVAAMHSVQLLQLQLLLQNFGYKECEIQNDKCPALYPVHFCVLIL
jgi:hypothetical protein